MLLRVDVHKKNHPLNEVIYVLKIKFFINRCF